MTVTFSNPYKCASTFSTKVDVYVNGDQNHRLVKAKSNDINCHPNWFLVDIVNNKHVKLNGPYYGSRDLRNAKKATINILNQG